MNEALSPTSPLRGNPNTAFDWAIYADATLAGLAILIPIPLVDWAFEEFFRRRIPAAIARHQGRTLAPEIKSKLNQSSDSCLTSCLALPVKLIFELIKRISRKLLYFLTIKEAADKVSLYWHRAFLIDYMLSVGDLEREESAQVARQALEQVLDKATTSPLTHLARQVTGGTRHILRTLRRARRGTEDEMIQQKKSQIAQHWADFEEYLKTLAADYDRVYQMMLLTDTSTIEKGPKQL